jgi:hypothetical protein
MMYPIRSTLLLTVDEKTATKLLREEASMEGANHMASHQPSRIALAICTALHGIGHLMLTLGQRLAQFDGSPRESRVGATSSK